MPEPVPTDGGRDLGHNPFGVLDSAALPAAAPAAPRAAPRPAPAARNRGRLEIRRETGGRGGKTVTVVDGFVGIGRAEQESLAKQIRGACGCGGTVKDGRIEIQGDQRETVARILGAAGFRPVLAGG